MFPNAKIHKIKKLLLTLFANKAMGKESLT